MAGRGVPMPDDVALDPVQSAIWGEIAPDGSGFTEQDVPALRLLCYWHAVARQAQAEMADGDGGIGVLERIGTKPAEGDDGEAAPLMRKHPALSVLKEASSEIRALSDQLGISPRSRTSQPQSPQQRGGNARILSMVLADREAKASKAAGA